MAESTVMEALTAELLGDVGLLHKQIKELPDMISGMSQDVATRFEAQTVAMLETTEKHRDLVIALVKQAEANIQSAATAAAESTKLDIKLHIKEHIHEALRPAMDAFIENTKTTTAGFKTEVTQAKEAVATAKVDLDREKVTLFNKVNNYMADLTKERWFQIGYCFSGGFAGTATFYLIQKIWH